MLNNISLMGRLTADVELKYTPSGAAVCSFTVACERDFGAKGEKKETDFIDVVAWRQTAEFVGKYFAKGQLMGLTGRLQTRMWEDKQGSKRKSVEIVAEHVYFAEGKRDRPNGPDISGADFQETDDGDLPF